MKGLILAAVLLLAGSTSYAGCFGPVCYDDKGLYFMSAPVFPSVLAAGVVSNVAPAAGAQYYCSDCVQTPACISTGTGRGALVAVSVSTSATALFGTCK